MSEEIRKLYQDAGFTPPKGKGIHTYEFHKCVVGVKKKIRDGKLPKTTNPYSMCMKSLGVTKAVKPSHRRHGKK